MIATVTRYGELTPRLLARFWSKVDTSAGPDGCWPWMASKRRGYGQFRLKVDGRSVLGFAHRLSLLIATGHLGDTSLHSCDNPPCCNPAHLSWGTRADNVRDMVERGRAAAGERSYGAKLSDRDAAELLRLLAAGMTHEDAASKFGISATLVSHVRNGKTRSHVDGPRGPGKQGRPRGWKAVRS